VIAHVSPLMTRYGRCLIFHRRAPRFLPTSERPFRFFTSFAPLGRPTFLVGPLAAAGARLETAIAFLAWDVRAVRALLLCFVRPARDLDLPTFLACFFALACGEAVAALVRAAPIFAALLPAVFTVLDGTVSPLALAVVGRRAAFTRLALTGALAARLGLARATTLGLVTDAARALAVVGFRAAAGFARGALAVGAPRPPRAAFCPAEARALDFCTIAFRPACLRRATRPLLPIETSRPEINRVRPGCRTLEPRMNRVAPESAPVARSPAV